MGRRAAGIAAVLAASLPAACSPDGEPAIRVLAAASLTDAFTELADAYEAAGGPEVALSFAGSSALRESIIEGAPADVFAAAHEEAVAGLAAESGPAVFASNDLVVAVSAAGGAAAEVAGVADLARPDLLVGLCAPEVPCGALAREALAAAGVTASVDTEERDARALLAKLRAGELDAGVVYRSDALAAGDAVRAVELPPAARRSTRYPIVVLDGAADGAAGFVELVLSEAGAAVLASHGFEAP